MSQRSSAVDLLILAAVGFGPLLLGAALGLLLLLLGLMTLSEGAQRSGELLGILGLIALLLVGMLGSPLLGRALLGRARGLWRRATALYVSWLPLTLLLCFLLALIGRAFAGASMAVADGVATGPPFAADLRMTLEGLAYAQVPILPWVLLAAWALPRLSPRWADPPAQPAPASSAERP